MKITLLRKRSTMKRKIVIITKCEQCPNYVSFNVGVDFPFCAFEDKALKGALPIPDWCPLEDAEQKHYGGITQ
jgi:hypothetical protein